MPELERLAGINRRLDLTAEILGLVAETCEVAPEKRPDSGRELVRRMRELHDRARGEASQ